MNSLSLFLYLIDVLASLHTFLLFATFGGPIFLGGSVLVCAINVDLSCDDDAKEWWHQKGAAASKLFLRYAWVIALVGGLLATLIPSKNTMYAIAASEIGEKIATNEAVQGIAGDATKALQQWIKRQIEPETKK
jgi:hypothetical protein